MNMLHKLKYFFMGMVVLGALPSCSGGGGGSNGLSLTGLSPDVALYEAGTNVTVITDQDCSDCKVMYNGNEVAVVDFSVSGEVNGNIKTGTTSNDKYPVFQIPDNPCEQDSEEPCKAELTVTKKNEASNPLSIVVVKLSGDPAIQCPEGQMLGNNNICIDIVVTCPAGEVLNGSHCEPASEGCASDSDCDADQVCDSKGQCVKKVAPLECVDNADCGDNRACMNKVCVDQSEGGLVGGNHGESFSKICENSVAATLKVTAGSYIEGLQIGCNDPLNKTSKENIFLEANGTMSDKPQIFSAYGANNLIGFQAKTCTDETSGEDIICGLQFITKKSGVTKVRVLPEVSDVVFGSAGHQPKYKDVEVQASTCAAGSLLIGLKGTVDTVTVAGKSKEMIRSLQSVCAPFKFPTDAYTKELGEACSMDADCSLGFCDENDKSQERVCQALSMGVVPNFVAGMNIDWGVIVKNLKCELKDAKLNGVLVGVSSECTGNSVCDPGINMCIPMTKCQKDTDCLKDQTCTEIGKESNKPITICYSDEGSELMLAKQNEINEAKKAKEDQVAAKADLDKTIKNIDQGTGGRYVCGLRGENQLVCGMYLNSYGENKLLQKTYNLNGKFKGSPKGIYDPIHKNTLIYLNGSDDYIYEVVLTDDGKDLKAGQPKKITDKQKAASEPLPFYWPSKGSMHVFFVSQNNTIVNYTKMPTENSFITDELKNTEAHKPMKNSQLSVATYPNGQWVLFYRGVDSYLYKYSSSKTKDGVVKPERLGTAVLKGSPVATVDKGNTISVFAVAQKPTEKYPQLYHWWWHATNNSWGTQVYDNLGEDGLTYLKSDVDANSPKLKYKKEYYENLPLTLTGNEEPIGIVGETMTLDPESLLAFTNPFNEQSEIIGLNGQANSHQVLGYFYDGQLDANAGTKANPYWKKHGVFSSGDWPKINSYQEALVGRPAVMFDPSDGDNNRVFIYFRKTAPYNPGATATALLRFTWQESKSECVNSAKTPYCGWGVSAEQFGPAYVQANPNYNAQYAANQPQIICPQITVGQYPVNTNWKSDNKGSGSCYTANDNTNIFPYGWTTKKEDLSLTGNSFTGVFNGYIPKWLSF